MFHPVHLCTETFTYRAEIRTWSTKVKKWKHYHKSKVLLMKIVWILKYWDFPNSTVWGQTICSMCYGKVQMHDHHAHPITVTPILAVLVFTTIPSSLPTNASALVQTFITSFLSMPHPSSDPFCPSTTDINQCLKCVMPFIYLNIFNNSSNPLSGIILYSTPGIGVGERFNVEISSPFTDWKYPRR